MHLQRAFVEAVYKVGLQASSPNTILENMTLKSYDIVGDQVRKGQDITGEHVKSHLQKHRKNLDKAMKEFMLSYDTAMSQLESIPTLDFCNQRNQPEKQLENAIAAMGCKPSFLLGAEPAAFLSFCSNPFLHPNGFENTCEAERDPSHSPANITIEEFHAKNPLEMLERCTSLSIPSLTEDEKKSSLGKTLALIMGMFDSFKQHILDHRRHQQSHVTNYVNSSALIKRNPQEESVDLATRASITPIDMDDMSKNYFVYEPSESSLTRLTRISSITNEARYHLDQYQTDRGIKGLKKTRANSSTPRIDNCNGHFNTTYQLTYDLKPDDNQTYELPLDADDRSIQRLVHNWNAHSDHPYSSVFNNSLDSAKMDFDHHFPGSM
jgi:SHAQKYF class myb-like DNA-binding protein